MRKVFINPQSLQVLEIVDKLCLVGNKKVIRNHVIEDYNSRIDVALAFNQTGYYESWIDLYVDESLWERLALLNEVEFNSYAKLRLGDQMLRSEFFPNNVQLSYELHSVYNIGSLEDEVIVDFRIKLNDDFDIVQVEMRYEDEYQDNKYMTKMFLQSVSS